MLRQSQDCLFLILPELDILLLLLIPYFVLFETFEIPFRNPDEQRVNELSLQLNTVHYCIFLIPNASVRYSLEPELFNVATSRAMYNTILVFPSTLYRDRIPKEVDNYLFMAGQF